MKAFCKLLFLSLIFTVNLFSEDKTEITAELKSIDYLIEVTKQNIALQEETRLQLIQYQKISKKFFQNPDDNELLFQTIKLADRLSENIQKSHLTQYFSPEFLKELALFSKLAKQSQVPKP